MHEYNISAYSRRLNSILVNINYSSVLHQKSTLFEFPCMRQGEASEVLK